MKKQNEYNLAFIDGQNLHLGTTQSGWKVDHTKLRVYLHDKYQVEEAYYFLGYVSEEQQELYKKLQKSGFIVVFKDHNSNLSTKKKGNVDTDIVFEVMRSVIDNKKCNNIVLISGDGDYAKMVKYLISLTKFKKILFPNKKFASSLYKSLGSEYFDYLENNLQNLVLRENKKGS